MAAVSQKRKKRFVAELVNAGVCPMVAQRAWAATSITQRQKPLVVAKAYLELKGFKTGSNYK